MLHLKEHQLVSSLSLMLMLPVAVGDAGTPVGLSIRVKNLNIQVGPLKSTTPKPTHCDVQHGTIGLN